MDSSTRLKGSSRPCLVTSSFYVKISDIKTQNSKLKTWIGVIFVFAATLLFSRWFWPELVFPDPDTFYHVKVTELLRGGILREFPWLPFTSLGQIYTDHHLLYHFFIFPFLYFFGPFVGMKIATQVLVAAAAALFYFLLRTLRVWLPFFWTALLLVSPTFLMRMHLAKAPAFSLIFILLGILALYKKKPLLLGVIAFFYVWAYGAWPLLPFIVIVWLFVHAIVRRQIFQHRMLDIWEYLKPVFGVVIGSLAGMIINPYFPKNVIFYWLHTIEIGVVNFQSKIGVGAEWYPPSFTELLGYHSVFFILVVLGLALFVFYASRKSHSHLDSDTQKRAADSFAFLVLAAVFFVLSVRSRRHIEYFMPLGIIGLSFLVTLARPALGLALKKLKTWFRQHQNWFTLLPAVILLFSIVIMQGNALLFYKGSINEKHKPDHFAGPTGWLQANVPSNAVVFHSEWDEFPFLFYGDDRLRYVSGMDSTFFYRQNPELYELWEDIVRGEYADDVVEAIKENFGADHALVAPDRETFMRQLMVSEKTTKVYEDEYVLIFEFTNHETK